MANLQIFKVTSMPATPVAHAIYYVQNGKNVDVYVTDKNGTAFPGMNLSLVNTLIAQSISNINEALVEPNYASMTELQPTLEGNTFIYVQDASGDTVNTPAPKGAALYLFDHVGQSFILVTDYNNVPVTLNWSSIQGKPGSTPSQIDTAVAEAHTHANKAQLDNIGEDATGALTYKDQVVSAQWAGTGW